MAQRICSIDGCEEATHARGWCSMHYKRWRRNGDPEVLVIASDPGARFWSKVRIIPDCCWEWQAGTTPYGYGHFSLDGRKVVAHRHAYESLIGPVPEGLQLDHLCRNPACIRPDHLEPVTASENVRRGDMGRERRHQTHCVNGHLYDDENTYWKPNGMRGCLACRRRTSRRWHQKQKEAANV